ncbi:MAG: carboxypeptidase regulatory-like domain-containing protein [Actinomycetota bacterium]
MGALRSLGRRRSVGRRWTASLALALSMALVAPSSAAPDAGAQEPNAKIEQKVFDDLEAGRGTATFWALMREKADLDRAPSIEDSDARGEFVYRELTSTADRTQADLRRFLTRRGVDFEPFWIANTIKITGDEALLREVAARPDVERILADRRFELPKPAPGEDLPRINVVEWNIDRVRADEVWAGFGVRGEGIVVAHIDTGAQFDHPALVQQYRGNLGGGSFDHNYNWFDPSNVCGNPSLVPCDNNGHGTHTTGTAVGDDGDPGPNQIGVAPHARWIAAKGCETNFCSTAALLASGQWVLAPTDLQGENPRPDLRPHVVNNSWGGGGGNPWYQPTVDAWIASGIFPSFSNGNSGPSCGSSGSPGDYVQSYSAGAFDINDNIAGFSSRGPSAFESELKPNIAAPGVGVRSSVPGNGYASFSGTSMAAPHVTGSVALIWSAAPAIERQIDATRTLLDDTAVDTSNLTCGGTADDNNVWGEGKLDALAAVENAPIGPVGSVEGTVTDAATGSPIEGARVEAVGPITRTVMTDATGHYSFPVLSVGSYEVTASKFGYLSQTATVQVNEAETTTQDFALQPAPSHTVSGHVRDTDGEAVANGTVTILGTPIPPATTDADGFYSFDSVPEGTYDVRAESGRCFDPQTQELVVDGDETLDFTLPLRTDDFGYFCQVVEPNYIEGDTPLGLSGLDAWTEVPLPFEFPFYGEFYDTTFASTKAYVNFLQGNVFFVNSAIPSSGPPNGAIYAFWDDLNVDSAASTWKATLGEAPNRRFVIEWRNVSFFGDSSRRVDVEIILHEGSGRILTQYRNIAEDGREQGNSATIGVENADGSDALQYSFNEAVVDSPEFAVLYRLPPSGVLQGTVTDANDDLPVSSARVEVVQDGSVVRSTTTDADGIYRMHVPLGTYTVEASKTNYETGSETVVLDEEDETVTQDFSLRTPRGEVSPDSLELVIPQGELRTRTLTLENTGSLDMTWEIKETGGGAASASTTVGLEKNPDYDPNSPTTEGLYRGGTPAGWTPDAPGDVIRSWPPTGLSLAWGVGFTGNVWLSDIPSNNRNHEFTVEGTPTGASFSAPWAGAWPGDMALDTTNDCMAQVNVGGDNGIYCWSLDDGSVQYSITGSFPWTTISQRGLAYRADDDTFYIGGWNQDILYHVRGLSHGTPGEVISQCSPPDGNISGLAWNPAFEIVWEATNTPTDTMYQLDPETCEVLSTLGHPSPGFDGAGMEMDEEGNLWIIDQDPNTVYLIESGVPAFVDVPWLSEDPQSGTLAPDASQDIEVTIDTTGLEPGEYNATIFILTNSGRQPTLRVPVKLIVPAYYQAANAGDGPGYVDGLGDTWGPDQAYSAGSWGYVDTKARAASTRRPIAGTEDDPLYQTQRVDPLEYRFDGLPEGVYQVDLRFADISGPGNPNTRLHDVIIEGDTVLPAHDIAAEVGAYAADDHTFFVPVTDGQLNVRLAARRGYLPPVINAMRVAERPDR